MGIIYNLETIHSCKEKLGLFNDNVFSKSSVKNK